MILKNFVVVEYIPSLLAHIQRNLNEIVLVRSNVTFQMFHISGMQEASHRFFNGLPYDVVSWRLQVVHGQHRRQRLPRCSARQSGAQISRAATLLQHTIPGKEVYFVLLRVLFRFEMLRVPHRYVPVSFCYVYVHVSFRILRYATDLIDTKNAYWVIEWK